MVSKEMKEIRGSVCCCHMEPSARKIYQPASRQSLVLNLSSGLCFSSYSWRSLKCLNGGSLACPLCFTADTLSGLECLPPSSHESFPLTHAFLVGK